MRELGLAASIAALSAATPAIAHDAVQGGGPPQYAVVQSNLGQAGLLRSYFESDQFGSVQWRVGQGRLTIGAAATPGSVGRAYRDGTTDTIVPLNFLFGLPDGASLVRLGVKRTFSNGADYPVELNGGTDRLDLQYLRFPNATTMWALGVLGEYTALDVEGSGTVRRPGGGVRGDILKEFAPHWGVAARAEYSWGESKLRIAAGPQFTLEHQQGEDHVYAQVELIGQFRGDTIGVLPEGWVMHPILGAQFQRSFIEATADSAGVVSSGVVGATEDYGTTWLHLRMEKEGPPGKLLPNFLLGFEQEYINDLDAVVKEPRYVVFGVGLSSMFNGGDRFEVSYTRHQGLHANRWNEGLVGTLTLNF